MLTYRNIKVDGSRIYNHSNASLLRNNSSHNAAVYEKQVVLLLQMLDHNSVGYLLLERIEESIRRSGHPMRIVPWDDAHQAAGGADVLSADRGPIDRQQSMNIVRAATSLGVETSHSSDVEHGEMGTGTGWAAVVMIDPTRLRNSPLSGVAGQPDEILFHELIHAKQAVDGRMNQTPVGGTFTNLLEFTAVTITDIYLCSKGLPWLRNTHQLLNVATTPAQARAQIVSGFHANNRFSTTFPGSSTHGLLSVSQQVAQEHRGLFAQVFANDPGLASSIAARAIQIHYNPYRDYLALLGR